jgi:predicted outer membrane repeat protein
MRVRFPKTVIVATATGLAAAAAGPLAAQAASASVSVLGTVSVPCNASTLTTDITGAASGETLQLAPGCTYVLTSALPAIGADLTLRGHSSTLERSLTGGPPEFSLLEVTSGANVSISGVNFVNGDGVDYGGAIYNDGGAVTVSGGTFSGNVSSEYGGAIYNKGYLSVTGSTFTGNTAAPGYYGGAIYNDYDLTVSHSTFTGNSAEDGGAVYNTWNLVVANSVFSGNSAADYGGGLYISDDGITTVNSSSFLGNTAVYGGGAYNYGYSTTFLDTQFDANQASEYGGGIENDYYLTLTGVSVYGNTAIYGGGLYSDYTDSNLVTDDGTSFTSNTAEDGGGLYVGKYATLTAVAFQRNSAYDAGGGIYVNSGADHLTLQNSSITSNGAPSGDGGGVYNDSTPGTVSLIGTDTITGNLGGNCAPASSVDGCTG